MVNQPRTEPWWLTTPAPIAVPDQFATAAAGGRQEQPDGDGDDVSTAGPLAGAAKGDETFTVRGVCGGAGSRRYVTVTVRVNPIMLCTNTFQ
jgi:hypothetical protein